jgi:hypothetical protein
MVKAKHEIHILWCSEDFAEISSNVITGVLNFLEVVSLCFCWWMHPVVQLEVMVYEVVQYVDMPVFGDVCCIYVEANSL